MTIQPTRTILALGTGLWLAAAGPALAHGEGHHEKAGHSHEMAELHGGNVVMTEANHFETLFTPKEARVYCYDAAQKPIAEMKDVTASLMLHPHQGDPVMMDMLYMAPDSKTGRTQGYFYAPYDFSGVKGGMMKAMVSLAGLREKPVSFKTAVTLGEPATYVCPMGDSDPAPDPGSCPKCGMTRQKKMAEGMHGMMHGMHDDADGDHDHDETTGHGHH